LIHFENVSKIYRTRRGAVKALDDVSFQVKEGGFVVIRGPSGGGKTTLLLTAGGMLRPTKGRVMVDGNDIYAMNEPKRAKFRTENIGFVFQMFHLVPYLNVIENVLLASNGMRRKPVNREEARELLKRLGLFEREHHLPSELSVGQKQRTAIARALFNQPKTILADEPTGNLDPKNAAEVIGYLADFHRHGGTVVIVTHGGAADKYADCVINLGEGRIEGSI
jgi:ABC-type lipoprotein export system ATPase subunit